MTFNFYIILYCLLLIFYLVFQTLSKDKQRTECSCFIFFSFVLFVVSAIRADTVGGDLENYIPHFQEMCSTNIRDWFSLYTANYEPGYTIITGIISLLSNSVPFYLFVTSFLSLFGVFLFIYKYSSIPCISLFLYYSFGYYTNTFNNIRQSIAISFFLLFLALVSNRKYIKYTLGGILITSIHSSAFLCVLLAPFVKFMKGRRKKVLWFLFISALVFSIGISIFTFFRDSVFIQYSSMIDNELLQGGAGWNLLVFYFAMAIVSLYASKTSDVSNTQLTKISSTVPYLFMMAFIMQIMATQMATFTRASLYFSIPAFILFPNLIYYYKQKNIRVLILTLLLSFSFLFMSLHVYKFIPFLNSNSQGVLPYAISVF